MGQSKKAGQTNNIPDNVIHLNRMIYSGENNNGSVRTLEIAYIKNRINQRFVVLFMTRNNPGKAMPATESITLTQGEFVAMVSEAALLMQTPEFTRYLLSEDYERQQQETPVVDIETTY